DHGDERADERGARRGRPGQPGRRRDVGPLPPPLDVVEQPAGRGGRGGRRGADRQPLSLTAGLESDLSLSKPAVYRSPMATQHERRTATRSRLLDAALAVLVDHGAAGFTTTEVGRRAGMSQGAIFKHFATKADLLAATVEHLFAALVAQYEGQFATVDPVDDPATRLRVGLDLLWEVFQDERLLAAYDLFTAARTDPDLRADLQPVVRAHVAN